jgi:hypothetical protein
VPDILVPMEISISIGDLDPWAADEPFFRIKGTKSKVLDAIIAI